MALQAYFKQANDTEMEARVAAIKLRAHRRIGEISKGLEKQKGFKGNQHEVLPAAGKKQILEVAGLSTSAANRYEKLSEIPESVFEDIIEYSLEQGRPVTYLDVEKQIFSDAKKKAAAAKTKLRWR